MQWESQLRDIKEEVVSAHNQSIKTDNQVKNIALDFKSLERRFETLERRTRLASLGMYALVALVAAIASGSIIAVNARVHQSQLADVKADNEQKAQKLAVKEKEMNERLRRFEAKERSKLTSRQAAIRALQFIDTQDAAGAVGEITKIQLADLTDLERALVETQFEEFKQKTAEKSYRQGRVLVAQGKIDQALRAFEVSHKADPKSRYGKQALQLRAETLYDRSRYDEAIEVLEHIQKDVEDPSVLKDAQALLGISYFKKGRKQDAKPLLAKAASLSGRFQGASRKYLAILESEVSSAASVRPNP